MLTEQLCYKKHAKIILQSSVLWGIWAALFESFKIVTSSSVRYLGTWDVVTITFTIFFAYSVLWCVALSIIGLVSHPFWRRRNVSERTLLLSYLCISLLSYNCLWIFYQVGNKLLYNSIHGIFQSLTLLIGAALIAFGVFKITSTLSRKRYFEGIGVITFAFGLSTIFYMVLYVFLKSKASQGYLHPLYSIALFLPFLLVFVSLTFIFTKLSVRLYRTNLFSLAHKSESLTIVAICVSFIFCFVYQGLTKKDVPQGKPNILFISIDTLRADHVSIYNEIEKETSPNIDRIAQKGYVFKRAYTPSSWTLPAHASMMTGLFPSSHQADRSLHQTMSWPVDPLPYSALTLAEILRDNGYRTAGIISNPFVSSTFGMHQGFEFFDDQVDLFEDIRYLSLKDYSILFKILEIFNIIDKDDYDGEQRVIEVNKRALDWFQKHRDDSAPFFLFLHYNEPHFTYEPPWPYNKSKSGMQLDYFTDIELLNEGQFSLSSYGLNDLTALYDGEISYLDHHLGIFFKKLKQWNLLDNTLVIITSDHGESFNEHEIWQHGNSLYEEQIRVPLIIQHPKLVPSSIFDNDNIAQLVDLMPTILDILQIQIPAHIQGRSLLPIFQGKPELSFNLAFAEIRADINWKAQNPRYGDAIKAVLNKEWKYISYDNGREELYNLELDPQEKNNLFSAEIIKAKEMRELLNAWSHAVSPEKRDKKGKIDGGRLEQLRSLGYLQ